MPDPAALPRYLQVAEHLIREISAGRLREGQRLPPEREMASSYGIAVGTLRKALSDMEARGLLERRHGSGNYVKSLPKGSGIYAFFRLELIEGGGLPSATTLSLDTLSANDVIPGFGVGVGAGGGAHRVRRLRRLDGRPAALEEIWIDADAAPDLGRPSESLYRHLKRCCGLTIARVEDKVGVDAMPEWGMGLLERDDPRCGLVERIGWSDAGARVERSFTWFDPAVARYTARMG